MTRLVLARHGESEWNARELLTGWGDPPLTRRGKAQAAAAGRRLLVEGGRIDVVYTSLLARARETAQIMLGACGAHGTATRTDWRLNERHLGALEGLSKQEVRARFGNAARRRWRDDADHAPPALDTLDPRHPRADTRYRDVPDADLPNGEDRVAAFRRVIAAWHDAVLPDLLSGRRVLVVAHQGPLAAISQHLGLLGGTKMANADLLVVDLKAPGSCCRPARETTRRATVRGFVPLDGGEGASR